MHQYELMVILDPEIDERTVAPSLDKFWDSGDPNDIPKRTGGAK